MSWLLLLVPVALDLLGKAMGGGQSRHNWVDPGHHAQVQKQLNDAKEAAKRRAEEVQRFQNQLKKHTENVEKMQKMQEEQRKLDEKQLNDAKEAAKKRAEEVQKLQDEMKTHTENVQKMQKMQEEQRKLREQDGKQLEDAKKAAKQRAEEAQKLQEEMKKHAENVQKMQKLQEEQRRVIAEQDKQRAEDTARFMANMEEQRKQIEAERKLREESIAKAEAALRDAQRKEDDLMATLQMFSQGFSPILWPTQEEIDRASLRLGPDPDGYYHIAVAGYTGTGKSSIINTFRGVKNNNKAHAANVGVTETTTGIGRYPDPNQSGPQAKFIWYDIPGSGTLLKPGPQYFNDHGLFVFDIILVLFGGRFTQQDLAILEHAARFKVPTFLIRSKSNQYIENIIREELDYEGVQSGPEFENVYQQARELYERETKQSVQKNLGTTEYHDPNQKVYLVSAPGMRAYVNNTSQESLQPTSRWIDEAHLIENIVTSIVRRRFNPEKPDDNNNEVEAKIRDAMNLAKNLKKRAV